MSRSTGRLARTLLFPMLALGAVAGTSRVEGAEATPANARLRQARDRAMLAEAIRGAARRLGDPRCQELLGDFLGRSRRPLREALDAEGITAPEFLGRLYFYDGTESGCGDRRLAYTQPASRVVYVCASRFRELYQQNTTQAEVAVVHEALHCLGLGENPPTWQEINARVEAACRK